MYLKFIERSKPENSGQYKCYINYELTTYHHIEVLSPKDSFKSAVGLTFEGNLTMGQENLDKLTFMQEIMVYVLMGGLGIIILVLMLSFVYPYFRPHKKGTMPSNLGLIQQRCVKKIMEHVDAKTSHNDVDDQGRHSKMMVAVMMLSTLYKIGHHHR